MAGEKDALLHRVVLETTEESSLCELCACEEGDRELGLLHGFAVGRDASTRKISACFDHRLRLSLMFELREKIQAALPGRIAVVRDSLRSPEEMTRAIRERIAAFERLGYLLTKKT